jgi:hypothetical protein
VYARKRASQKRARRRAVTPLPRCGNRASRAVRVVAASLGVFALTALPCLVRAQTMETRAKNAVDAVRPTFETPQDVERTMSNPLNGASQFSSFDGASPFSQPIACLASNSFLEVFFAPSSTGDLSPVIIRQDTNFDDAFDATQTLPAPVSGVCANGVVSCAPGTWNSCQAYAWSTSPANILTLTPASLDQLGGCYCVNDSCGTNVAVLNESYILSDLAGGMAGALGLADPRFAVSTVGKTPFQISLSGQSTTACQTPPSLPQTQYALSPSQLPIDAAALSATDPVFQKVIALPAGTSVTMLDHACSIEKLASSVDLVTDVVKVSGSGEYSIDVISPTEMLVTLGREIDNHLLENCDPGFEDRYVLQALKPAALVSAVLEDGRIDDWLQFFDETDTLLFAQPVSFTNSAGPAPGPCERKRNDNFPIGVDLTARLSDGRPHAFRMRAIVGDRGERWVRLRIKTQCALDRTVVDTCATYATNNACQLRDEDTDGVITYSNGVATGLTPLPSTRVLGVSPCQFSVTEPWWRKDRTYRCTALGTGSSLPTPNLDRVKYVYDNSTITAWSDRYTDAGGNVVNQSGSLNPPEPVVVGDCEMMCKTTRDYQNTHLTERATAGTLQANPVDTEFQFHACSTGSCPVGPGERVVTDCSCIDSFPEAMVMMQATRLAVRDLICTTDTPVPFP